MFTQTEWGSGPTTPSNPIYTTPSQTFFSGNNINYTKSDQIRLQNENSGATGEIISNTISSNRAVVLNGLMWQGIALPEGASVNFQIAGSDCGNGATNPPACDNGTWNSSNCLGNNGVNSCYLGPGGTSDSNDVYNTLDKNIPVNVKTVYYNNKSFFRYKLFLKSGKNSEGPIIQDIFLNWSL